MTSTTEAPSREDFVRDWVVLFAGTSYSAHTGASYAPLGGTAPDITADRVAQVSLFWHEDGDYAETNVAAVVQLTDGSWAAVLAWCDTTGWGCQDGVEWRVTDSREGAIQYGLDKEARAALGAPLPGEAPIADADGDYF